MTLAMPPWLCDLIVNAGHSNEHIMMVELGGRGVRFADGWTTVEELQEEADERL